MAQPPVFRVNPELLAAARAANEELGCAAQRLAMQLRPVNEELGCAAQRLAMQLRPVMEAIRADMIRFAEEYARAARERR